MRNDSPASAESQSHQIHSYILMEHQIQWLCLVTWACPNSYDSLNFKTLISDFLFLLAGYIQLYNTYTTLEAELLQAISNPQSDPRLQTQGVSSNPSGQYATGHIGLIWKCWSPTLCTPTKNFSWHRKIHALGFHPALTHASNNLPSAKSVTFLWEGSSAWQGKTQEASAQQFMPRVRYFTMIKQASVGVTDFRFLSHFSLLPFVLSDGR